MPRRPYTASPAARLTYLTLALAVPCVSFPRIKCEKLFQSNGDARVVMRGSSHHSSGFSPYLSPGGNCDTRLARTHTHREDMEKEDWVA